MDCPPLVAAVPNQARPKAEGPPARRPDQSRTTDQEGHVMTQSTRTTTKPKPTVEELLQQLQDERSRIQAARDGDLLVGATEVATWKARDRRRTDRLEEIELEFRGRREYRSLWDTHPEVIRTYANIAVPARRRLRVLADGGGYGVIGAGNPSEDRELLLSWYSAIGELMRALPSKNPDTQSLVHREVDLWMAARTGWLCASSCHTGHGDLPRPEIGRHGVLPAGTVYGLHRCDVTDDD